MAKKKLKLKPFKVNVTIVVHEKNWIAAWDFVERKLGGDIQWVEESESST